MNKYTRTLLIILWQTLPVHTYRQPYIPLSGTARLGSEKLSFQRICEGENPNQADEYGNTPLHYAVFIQSKEVTNLLLFYRANPNAQNLKGKTPLHIAVQKKNDYLARRLMKYGANPNIQDKQGNTPLHIAAHNGDEKHARQLVYDLLCHGANRTIKNNDGKTALELLPCSTERKPIVHARYKLEKERKALHSLLASATQPIAYQPKVRRCKKLYF
jgi:hypothetical protein